MKPTDKEYIEALALQEYPPLDNINIDKVTARVNKRNGFKAGYQLALSHTNHAELVEAVKELMNAIIDDNKFIERNFQKIANVNDLLTKSETSKL